MLFQDWPYSPRWKHFKLVACAFIQLSPAEVPWTLLPFPFLAILCSHVAIKQLPLLFPSSTLCSCPLFTLHAHLYFWKWFLPTVSHLSCSFSSYFFSHSAALIHELSFWCSSTMECLRMLHVAWWTYGISGLGCPKTAGTLEVKCVLLTFNLLVCLHRPHKESTWGNWDGNGYREQFHSFGIFSFLCKIRKVHLSYPVFSV